MASEIPVGRGLGSSGAAVAAGLLLAASLVPEPPDAARLLEWGIRCEGHPDNVAASLLGGCTLCHPDPSGAGPACIAQPVHPSIAFAVAWPARPLSTAEARAALPDTVPHADAVENPRRLALLLEGLRTGNPRWLSAGGEDRLHVDARLSLIPGARRALEAARDAGAWLATLSGAGSGTIALGSHDRIESIAAAMRSAFRQTTGAGEARVPSLVRDRPVVLEL